MAEQGLRRTGGTELNLESMGVNLPYSMQAEQSVLGAALLQADIIPELVELLRPEMFYARQNGQIFADGPPVYGRPDRGLCYFAGCGDRGRRI